jgi:hypothetical protein
VQTYNSRLLSTGFKLAPFSKNDDKSLRSIYTYCYLDKNFFKVVCVRNRTLTFKGCLQILSKLQGCRRA